MTAPTFNHMKFHEIKVEPPEETLDSCFFNNGDYDWLYNGETSASGNSSNTTSNNNSSNAKNQNSTSQEGWSQSATSTTTHDDSFDLAPLNDPCNGLDPFTFETSLAHGLNAAVDDKENIVLLNDNGKNNAGDATEFEEVQVVKNKRKRSGDGKNGSSSETYICDYCDASFTLLHNAQAHIITYHVKGKQKKMSDRRVRYKCKKCGKLFLSPEAVKHHHNRFHSKSMKQCPHCDKEYKSQSCLQEHINSIHLNLRPFVCDQCSAAFGHKCVLRRHYMIKHLNFEYRCPYNDCTHPGFKCSKAVTAHIRSVHTHVRPYPCSICGLRFVRRNDMVVHKKCHSNKYDHECPECKKCFRQKTNLRSHMKKIHKESAYVI